MRTRTTAKPDLGEPGEDRGNEEPHLDEGRRSETKYIWRYFYIALSPN